MQDRYNDPEDGEIMQFRLTYEGSLYSTQKDLMGRQPDKRAEHKHDIRKRFHFQLKRLWEKTPFLRDGRGGGPEPLTFFRSPDSPKYDRDTLAERYNMYGYNFVPLVTVDLNLLCGLDILFLRDGHPGNAIASGDIDNRLKTLFDALRIPIANEGYSNRQPEEVEKPFYCLLEDDKLITKVSVETDQLLQDVSDEPDVNDVRLVITVTLRPFELHLGNMQFG
jgi:hypothetical protein